MSPISPNATGSTELHNTNSRFDSELCFILKFSHSPGKHTPSARHNVSTCVSTCHEVLSMLHDVSTCHSVTQTLKRFHFILCLRATTTRRHSQIKCCIHSTPFFQVLPLRCITFMLFLSFLPGETTSVTPCLLTWMTKPFQIVVYS